MLPGNDVATGLKWAMRSNSIVLMPTPDKETWLMEGRLVGWKHYVPVDTPDEVDGVLEWLRSHDTEAQAIVRNANKWVNNVHENMWEYSTYVIKGLVKRYNSIGFA